MVSVGHVWDTSEHILSLLYGHPSRVHVVKGLDRLPAREKKAQCVMPWAFGADMYALVPCYTDVLNPASLYPAVQSQEVQHYNDLLPAMREAG